MGLLSKLKQKWNNYFHPKYELDVGYKIVTEHLEQYNLAIQILKGPYEGAVFGYKNITMLDDGRISFDPIGIEAPAGKGSGFTSDEKFGIIAGDIFVDCLEHAIGNYKDVRKEILNDEENRVDYIEEPFEERIVRKKGNSVPKRRVHSRQKRKTRFPGDSGLHSKVQPPAHRGSDPDFTGE
jgi:hypothetical protein